MKVELRLDDVLAIAGGVVVGDASVVVTGLNGIDLAGPGDLTFAGLDKYLPLLASTRATAVFVRSPVADCPATQIVVDDPNLAFNRVLSKLVAAADVARVRGVGGIHPTAFVDPSAVVDPTATVGPQSVVCAGARIGARTVIAGLVYVGHGSHVGDDCLFHAGARVMHGVRIGSRVILQPGCVVGSDGFGYATGADKRHEKIPQVGGVIVGDDVEIGACTTVDRGRFSDTRIGRGTKIDNLVQVAHNVVLGEDCILVAHCGIAGSATLGNRNTVGAMTGVTGHVTLADDVRVSAMSGVSKSIATSGDYLGIPAKPILEGSKIRLSAEKVPALLAKVRDLEARLAKLERTPGASETRG